MRIDIIENLRIDSSFVDFNDLAVIPNSILLKDLRRKSYKIQNSDFVVVDEKQHYFGIFSFRQAVMDELSHEDDHLTISHLVNQEVPCLGKGSSLGKAMQIILDYDVDKVAVIDRDIVLGYINVKDIFNTYLKAVKKTFN